MKSILRKIAYMLVLIAMVLLMGEMLVPHHHCVEMTAGVGVESVHFGYGDCKECDGCESEHSHSGDSCCDDTQLYFRSVGEDSHLDKKFLLLSNPFFIQPEQMLSFDSHVCCTYNILYRLKVPDVGASFTSLRAPPVA